ncbi:MAG: inositol monophosphatase [Rhodospirillales bacterium]
MQKILDRPERVRDIMHDVAAEEILPRFNKLNAADISEKKPGDLVTIADRASEEALRKRLTALLPGSAVIGEEDFESNPESLRRIAGEAPVWIIDPVDGTHNFAHGKSPFTVIVALLNGGETHAGWIIDPLAGDALWAMRGSGAWQQNASGSVTQITRPAKTFAASTMTAGHKLQQRLIRAADALSSAVPTLVERYRCVGREYMDIADGTLDMARYNGILKPWDHAAGCLIVRECGGQADNIKTAEPYRASPALATQSIGIVGDRAHWPAFQQLIERADALIDQH